MKIPKWLLDNVIVPIYSIPIVCKIAYFETKIRLRIFGRYVMGQTNEQITLRMIFTGHINQLLEAFNEE